MPVKLQRRLFICVILLALIAGALLTRWLLVGRYHESTDNAYV